MRHLDLLAEAFPYPPGDPSLPDSITDYRDPKVKTRSSQRSYTNGEGRRVTSRSAPIRTHLVLTKGGGTIVFYYGSGVNTIDYGELLAKLGTEMDETVQDDIFGVVVKATGYLIERSRQTGGWGGDRNRYSADVARTAQALLDRGLASPSTPIWLGNWAAHQGEHIGTIRTVLQNAAPRRLVLYHGTDTFRLKQIMQTGLRPLAMDDRVWKGSLDKRRAEPEHRQEAVYLTASRPQAEYYAKKAVQIDRVRFGPSKRRDLTRKMEDAKARMQQMQARLDAIAQMSPDDIAREEQWRQRYHPHYQSIEVQRQLYPEMIAKAQSLIDQTSTLAPTQFYGKIEPVILQVTLTKKEFASLVADDDFLARHTADATDWVQSLSVFSQIAFRGTIPPERLKVLATGDAAGRASR